MLKLNFNFVYLIVVLPLLISCENNFQKIHKINFSEFSPTGEADNFVLKYTDSGKIKAVLLASKMKDYAAVRYPFSEFPNGINVTLYDNKAKKIFVKSDYAITYKGTDIINLKKNVKLTSENGQVLQTEQLYYDQKNEWFFTEKHFTFTDPNKGLTTGEGIDFDKNFKIINYQTATGIINQTKKI